MISELKNTFEKFNKGFSKTSEIYKIRLNYFNKFQELGFPNKKLEDWKFSDFNTIISKRFKDIKIDLEKKNKGFNFNNYVKEFEHNKIIFFNGFFDHLSFEYENKNKWNFENLKNINPETFNYESKGNNSLNFLNNAFFTDGLLLDIEDNYEFKKPLIIYNIFHANENNNFFNQKIDICLGKNSKLDFIIYTINLGSKPIFLNITKKFSLKRYALLKTFYLDKLNSSDLNYNFTNAKVMENAIFENFIFSSSSGFIKNEILCELSGTHCAGFINGAICIHNEQHHEIKTCIDHQKKNTKSYQKIKSVVDKNSKGVFQGKIYVNSKAQKTNGYQLSKAILLDKDSEFDSKPELEIYADDVKCSHGSSSGSLDENVIFYMMSRGLKYYEAKRLLIQGFLIDSTETITNKEIKDFFKKQVEKRVYELR